jgi:hypothetical protein
MVLGRSTPDPRVGALIELSGGDTRGLLNLIRIGKTLPSQRIAAEEPPPPFLQVQPAGSFRNEDMVETWMLSHPGTGLGTAVTAEIIGDHEDVAHRIVDFNVSKQSDVVRRVARSSTPGQLLAIAHTQRSIHPGLLRPAAVIERRFDTVPSSGPTGRWREGAGNYWPEFVGADGRRPLGRLGVMADNRGSAADEVWIITGSPTMGVTPAHALVQINSTDLAAFDLDSSCFGSLGQRIERPLG